MTPKIKGIGFDIIDIARFKNLKEDSPFLQKIFTDYESAYCFSYKNPAPHLAGIFAAKEAALKALDINKIASFIEIRHKKSGKPEIWIEKKQAKKIRVSISHTDFSAGAVVVAW